MLDGFGKYHRACKLFSIKKILVVSVGIMLEFSLFCDRMGDLNLGLLNNKVHSFLWLVGAMRLSLKTFVEDTGKNVLYT